MTTISQRLDAALAVVRGRPVEDVAAEFGVDPELVERWVDQLLEGGRLRMAGRMDPSSFEARDRFLVLIAHEFRTPLAVIGGWVETLRSRQLPPDVVRKGLDTIARQVAALEQISRDALDAGAVARGTLRLQVRPVDLQALVAAAADPVRDRCTTVAPGPPLEVVADPSRLEQVTGDVLAHARRLAGEGPVQVRVTAEDDRASVTVTVPGATLGFADATNLFEPYVRDDTSVGTGIGLYLSRALLAAHDGEIGIRNEGGATVFWYRLPIQGPGSGPLVERV